MICECDGYKWMGPSLSSVALTTSTVEDRFSFTGNKDIREHFVLCLRIRPWIGLSCICGRHSSASFLSFVDWRLKHCSANKKSCFAPSSNVVCFNDPVCVCFDTWFQPRDPFRSLNCIMVFLYATQQLWHWDILVVNVKSFGERTTVCSYDYFTVTQHCFRKDSNIDITAVMRSKPLLLVNMQKW